jgi:hypothetical protein
LTALLQRVACGRFARRALSEWNTELEFENRCGLQAALSRGELAGQRRTLAVIIAKGCAELRADNRFEFVPEVAVPVAFEPVKHPMGLIPADVVIRKRGLDVMALGKAYHPRMEGGRESRVAVRVDAEERQLCVFGERRWYKVPDGSWAVSEPIPFSLMDLTWEQSFGGSSFDEWGNDMPHPLNPDGKGYIASKEAVDGTALPNVEDADHLIHSWQDQPRPCNIAPAPKAISFDPTPYVAQLEAARKDPFRLPDDIWNDAVPKFQFAATKPGSQLRLTGMSETPLSFELPAFRLHAEVRLGSRQAGIALILDSVLFLPEQRRCLLTWRGHFTYEFVPRERRRVVLERHG